MLQINEIDSQSLAALLESEEGKNVQLIDVRSPTEVAQAAIPGSVNIPLHLIPVHGAGIDRDKKAIMVCRSGARSAQACAYLAGRGYDQVINLRGGVIDWARHGLPLQQGAMSAISNG